MLIRHALGGAIDHHCCLFEGFLRIIRRLHAQLFKFSAFFCGYDEFGTTPDEIFDFGAISQEGAILVERDLINPQVLPQRE
jgi:hypothetical protein